MISKYLKNLQEMVQKGEGVFIAPTATVIGNVELGNNSSVWFSAVIRGDSDKISIGERTNIQDGAVVHCDPGVPVVIGNEVIVGHQAIVHGAIVGNNTLIGMGATVLNNAKVGRFCIIGAHALVTSGMVIPDYSVVMGVPGRITGKVSEKKVVALKRNAEVYVEYAANYLGR